MEGDAGGGVGFAGVGLSGGPPGAFGFVSEEPHVLLVL